MKIKFLPLVAGLIFSTGSLSAGPVPVNIAESVFEPFFDSYLSNASTNNKPIPWKCSGGKYSTMFGLNYSYSEKDPKDTGTISFSRTYNNLDCAGFDQAVLLIRSGKDETVSLKVTTDTGNAKVDRTVNNGASAMEVILKLPEKSKLIKDVTFTISAPSSGRGNWKGSVLYLSLRNSEKEKIFKKHLRDLANIDWDRLLKSPDGKISCKPQYNLILSSSDAETWRKYRLNAKLQGKAQEYKKLPAPEKMIDLYTTAAWAGANRQRNRYKELGLPENFSFTQTAEQIAMLGFILQDRELLRLAARYAICLALAHDWDSMGEMACYPGGTRDQMAFAPSRISFTICYIMDFAGDCFTAAGRNFLMKALARKGIGQINWTSWRWGYIFHCNQMAAFNYGRIAAYLIFERYFKHVKPYTKIAMDNLNEAMNNCFTQDGGYLESPNYLGYTLYCAQRSYLVFANMRKQKLFDVVPASIRQSDNFAQAIISTDKRPGHSIIPFGQCARWNIGCIEFLAAANTQSAWVNIVNRGSRADQGNIYTWIFLRSIPKTDVKLKNFVLLKKAGLVSSLRHYKKQPVKILLLGFNDKVGKRNEDIGSFVLEFAGNTFFMDPPVYHSANTGHDQCQWHNMLVPYGSKEYHPRYTSQLWGSSAAKMAPSGAGDDKFFQAEVDTSRSWRDGGIRKHVRKIQSPTPDLIKITDTYKLRSGTKGVNFYLQTYLPVEIKGKTVIVKGEFGGSAEIKVPDGCSVKLEKYTLQQVKGECTRICVSKSGRSGTLETLIKLKYDDNRKIH